MDSAMKTITLIFLGLSLLGCKGSPGGPGATCDGFLSPSANIYVRSSIHHEIVTNATVIVNSIGDSESASNEAVYTDGDDGLSNSEDYAYYTEMGINESNWILNYSVSAPGFESVDSEDYEFILETSCMAENKFVQDVYLCPNGESCD